MEKKSKEKSRYLNQYLNFVGGTGFRIEDPSREVLKRYRATPISADALARRRRKFDLRLIYTSKNASTAAYIVDLGRFRMTINILNLQGKSPTPTGGRQMGSGSFGTVLVKNVADTEFVAKIITLNNETPEVLEDIVLEVAISKLCAMFGIAPDVETSIPYDLIVYEDAAQFHLEKCESICLDGDLNKPGLQKSPDDFTSDLVHCMKVLGSLHIAHKDIKPTNILYCMRLDQFVLCDFGCSEYVKEAIGEVSVTNYAGTRGFMGPQMAALESKPGDVDLYYNDVYACKESIELCSRLSGYAVRSNWKKQTGVSSRQYLSSDSNSENQPTFPQPLRIESVFQRPDSYEFYRVHYAATALSEHEFNLKENLHRLTEEQQAYIRGILMESLNRSKMERVLRELQDLKPEEGTLEKKWLDDFVAAYRKNFDLHRPLFAQMPPLSREWVSNLTRLLGKNQLLSQIYLVSEESLRQLNQQQLKNVYENIVEEVREQRLKRLFNCRNDILERCGDYLRASGLQEQDIGTACNHIIYGFFSYETKEILLHDLLQSTQKNTPSNRPLLHCLAAILNEDSQASHLLLQFVQAEQSLERCLMLCWIHYDTSEDKSTTMLAVCTILLERLGQLPVQCWFPETVCILRIQFFVKVSRRELNHHAVRAHFEKILQLLARHSSHQDARSILIILGNQLKYFQRFSFPQQDIRAAHVEFEQCRQFYSGMENQDTDMLVINTYREQSMLAPQNMTASNQLGYQLVRLGHQLEQLYSQGRYHEALEVQRKITALWRDKQRQDGSAEYAQIDISCLVQEANILQKLGRVQQADELLLSLADRVLSSSNLTIHIDYYHSRVHVSLFLGRHHEALSCCAKAISFNDQVGRSSSQRTKAYQLRQLQANISGDLGQYENSLRVLSELRGLLMVNGRPESYELLAYNYSSAADAYRMMKRLHDSTVFCEKVFQLEQRGFILPHVSAYAHSIMAMIYGQQGRVNKSLEECWNSLERTYTLGDEKSCVVYTLILRSCEETVGSEALSFISYARKFTDPPRETARGKQVAKELYLSPVPTGLLPLDMPTTEFVRVAESRLRTLSAYQHFCCSQLKKQLLRVMPSKFREQSQFRLIYVRTLAEIALHDSIGWEGKRLLEQLDSIVEQMLECEVAEAEQESKQLLVECILERREAVRNAMETKKMLPACPAKYKGRAEAKRAH